MDEKLIERARELLLQVVDLLERALNIKPRTSVIRKWWRER